MTQLALSGNDNKTVSQNAAVRIVPNPQADNVTILDLGSHPPRFVATVQAPHSVVGLPTSVALTPDERLGLVASAQKLDPANPARAIPDNRHVAVAVINGSARASNHTLHGRGKRVVLRIEEGRLTRLHVQNMFEREIQGFGFDGRRLTPLPGRVPMDGGPSASRTAES